MHIYTHDRSLKWEINSVTKQEGESSSDMYIYIFIYIHVYTHVYIDPFTHVYIHINIYIYTHDRSLKWESILST
jgi:hypothetical protein